MSCLALSLQPVTGSDILLQTREWFPPARALAALSAFRNTRLAFAATKHLHKKDSNNNINNVLDTEDGLSADSISSLGDDPLAASSGQLIVGVENSEAKIRGADNWGSVEYHSTDHQASVDAFNNVRFELPPETIAAGDEVAAVIAPATKAEEQDVPIEQNEESTETVKDPFAASETLNKPQELVTGFKKTKDPSATDLTLALAGLDIPTLPPAEATQSTRIGVEGFEGDYGGIEFSQEQTSLGETFEGFSDAWGGGLDASEFVGSEKGPKKEGLSGLELLQTGDGTGPTVKSKDGVTGTPLENLLVQETKMKGPEMHIVETISAEFRESLLARTGLMGVVYLKTLPPKKEGDKETETETEFSFKVEGTNAVKRFVMLSSKVSSLNNGMFHVRTPAASEPMPLLKYSLLPKLTPLPLRVRLTKRHSGTLLSVMIQYVSNPDLPAPLTDVTFVLKLPVDPTLIKVSPKAVLNRPERELKWHIPEISLKGPPGRLRVRMPVDSAEDEELEVVGSVQFSAQGILSLSGVCLKPASEGKTDFYEVGNKYESGVYLCN